MARIYFNGLVYDTINNETEVKLYRTEGLKRPVRNIPAEVEYDGKKYKVTSVHGGYDWCGGAFQDDGVLTNLSLPETIKEICDGYTTLSGAFKNCKKLKDIFFPDSLEKIGSSAFLGCSAVETLYLGNNLKSIGEYSFCECIALKEIDYNDKLETISECAFYNCSSLKNVSFPESLKTIESGAFKGCKAMTEVNIPASVESISSRAFVESGVKVVNIYSENINIASDAFPSDAQINFLDANSFPKRKRKPRGAKNMEAPQAAHVSEEPTKPAPKEEKVKETPKVVPVDMEKLIQAALADGVVTDKERSILIKKVKEAGGDVDEFEMLLDARIFEVTKKEEKNVKPTPVEKPIEEPAPKTIEKPVEEISSKPAAKTGGFLKKLLGGIFSSRIGETDNNDPVGDTIPVDEVKISESDNTTAGDMYKLHLKASTTVENLRKEFNEAFGAQIKLYNGNKKAEMTDTLGTLDLTTDGVFECRSSLTVASFIDRMMKEHGLKVKVYTCDEWVAVLDGLTLKSAGLVKKNATKADMEGMVAYQRDGAEEKHESIEVSIKKSASFEDYTIVIMKNNKVVVGKGDDFYDNAKGALREIAGKVGFEVDPKWTTQQLGSKLVDFINKQ
jgi:hypothetical protein